MRARWPVWIGGWLAATALAFLVLNWVLALFVAIVGLTVVVVAGLAADWENHPSYEDRELARARRRAERRARTAPARARDRERWRAQQAKRDQAPDAG